MILDDDIGTSTSISTAAMEDPCLGARPLILCLGFHVLAMASLQQQEHQQQEEEQPIHAPPAG
jgi:hypothetical protein